MDRAQLRRGHEVVGAAVTAEELDESNTHPAGLIEVTARFEP